MKYVCANCFSDEDELKAFIKQNATEYYCDYCGQGVDEYEDDEACEEDKQSELISTDFDTIVAYIKKCLEREYSSDPWEDGLLAYDNEIDDLFGVLDTVDVFEEVKLEINNQALCDDIIAELDCNYKWCRHEGYLPTASQQYILGWEKFSNAVKHQYRYTFFRQNDLPQEYGDIPIQDMLDHLAATIRASNLVTIWDSGKKILRGRIGDDKLSTAADLGSPPPKSSQANRMNPPGISMFYGAFDEETILKELRANKCEYGVVSVGTFQLRKSIKVLDLTQLRKPSLFGSQDESDKRAAYDFLISFVAESSKPMSEDDTPSIEYVPTQIFTEYIRYLFRISEKDTIMGIVYPSSVNKGHNCCVIFADNSQCSSDNDNALLYLKDVHHIRLPL